MVFIVTDSVAEIKAAFASSYLTGSIRLLHFSELTPKMGCVNCKLTGTDIYCLIPPAPNCFIKSSEEANESFPR